MTIPEAFDLLDEGARTNPGEWVARSIDTAFACASLAGALGLDGDQSYAAGLLHDIGFSRGPCGVSHALRGHDFLMAAGFPEGARVCLSHSFPSRRVSDYPGVIDVDPAALQERLDAAEFGDLDRVVQLCCVLADREGAEAAREAFAAESGGARSASWIALAAIRRRFEDRSGKSLAAIFAGRGRG